MIAGLVVLVGLLLIVLPGLAGPSVRLPAAEWARLAGSSLLLGFAAVEVGLALVALPTVLRALHAAGIATICEHVLGPLFSGPDAVGWISASLAIVVGLRGALAGRSAYRKARANEIEPWLGRHVDHGDFELVVLPTSSLVALSVPAAPPQVLISDGLVDRLDSDQLEAVIRHEATHHRFRHWRFTLLATAVERALVPLPLVSRSTRSLRTALEAWADEAAAGRSASGRAVVRDAIVAVSGPVHSLPSRASQRDVDERTRRLEGVPDVGAFVLRAAMHAPVLMLGVAAVALLAGWVVDAHHATALAGYCPD